MIPPKDASLVGGWVLFAITLPWTLLMWFVGALAMVAFIAHRPSFVGFGILKLYWRPWLAKRWGYSTTLGRTIIYRPTASETPDPHDERVERHELVHVRQLEDSSFRALVVGIVVAAGTGDWWWFPLLWLSGGFLFGVAYITAAIRYGIGNAYRDAETERSAYAQTDGADRTGPDASWWDYRDRTR